VPRYDGIGASVEKKFGYQKKGDMSVEAIVK
jgi:hypothetical protein